MSFWTGLIKIVGGGICIAGGIAAYCLLPLSGPRLALLQ